MYSVRRVCGTAPSIMACWQLCLEAKVKVRIFHFFVEFIFHARRADQLTERVNRYWAAGAITALLRPTIYTQRRPSSNERIENSQTTGNQVHVTPTTSIQ
jgi:hypothetical protein